MQYYRRISDQSEMENSLLVAVGLLSRDAADTASRAIAWTEDPPEGPALTFPVPRDAGGNLLVDHSAGNRLKFGGVVSYRVLGTDRQLRRYFDTLAAPVGIPPHPLADISPPHDAAFYAVPGKEHKVLARGVVEFALTAINVTEGGGTATEETTEFAKADLFEGELKLEKEMSERRYAVSMELQLVPKN